MCPTASDHEGMWPAPTFASEPEEILPGVARSQGANHRRHGGIVGVDGIQWVHYVLIFAKSRVWSCATGPGWLNF